jgi:hypothetical protein
VICRLILIVSLAVWFWTVRWVHLQWHKGALAETLRDETEAFAAFF